MATTSSQSASISRRTLIRHAALAGAATGIAWGESANASERAERQPNKRHPNGPIKQSVVSWCFAARGEKWSLDQTCKVAKEIGYQSVELVSPDGFATLKRYGLTCAIVSTNIQPGPAFMRGFNNPRFHPMVLGATRQAIEAAAEHGMPSVIAFTGFSAVDPSDPNSRKMTLEEGADNCTAGFKQVVGLAEEKGVTICLEMLNTRDDSDPMKGHPGYQGDHTDYCIDIIKRVGSPRLKLLFDIYHVQIMDGDIIRRIRQHKDYLGHIHTAGNPGRGELDENQEILYPAVMRALLEVGYQGFVGQEFIPTRNPREGLQKAFTLCDV